MVFQKHQASVPFQINYIPRQLLTYQDIAKLELGSQVKISKKAIEIRSLPKSLQYWALGKVVG
jgi:hypothetical protein